MEPVLITFSLLVMATAGAIYLIDSIFASSKIEGFPEPPGHILVGHIFKMGMNPEKTFLNWKLTYGPAFQIRIFHIRVLVLGSKSAISECLSSPHASGRPRVGVNQTIYEAFGGGPVFGEGPEYDELRQFFMKTLPTHGDGRRKLEASFQMELQKVMSDWRERENQVFDLDGITGTYVVNSIWNVIACKKFNLELVQRITLAFERLFRCTTLKQRMQFLFHNVFLKIGLTSAWKTYRDICKINEICLELIDEHEKVRSPGNPCDIIDQMLEKRDKTTDPKSVFHPSNAHQAFRLAELWAASIETTTRTIEYLILLMSQHAEIVARVRREILDVIGLHQEPQMCHWELMPFSAACVTEVVRIFPAAVTGIPHKALQNFEFRNSLIPKGTIIKTNIWGVNHDPDVWVNPKDFNPARFLNSEGKLDTSMRSQVVTFSLGRRQCPGQQMSLDAIFLFLVTTFRHFDFESVGPVDFSYKYRGTSMAPKDGHRIKIVPCSRSKIFVSQ